MKKIISILLILSCALFLSSCGKETNPEFILSPYIYLRDDNIVRITSHIERKMGGRYDDDPQTCKYFGESIYSYEIKKDNDILYSYNNNSTTLNEDNELNLLGAIWGNFCSFEREVAIKEIGTYTIDLKASFVYTYSGLTHTYIHSQDIVIDNISSNITTNEEDEIDYLINHKTTVLDVAGEYFYETIIDKDTFYEDVTGQKFNYELDEFEYFEIIRMLQKNNFYSANEKIIVEKIVEDGELPFIQIQEYTFSYTMNDMTKQISIIYTTNTCWGLTGNNILDALRRIIHVIKHCDKVEIND